MSLPTSVAPGSSVGRLRNLPRLLFLMDLPHEKAPVGSIDRSALLALVEPVLRAHGCALVEISFKTERPGWVLRVAIEKTGSQSPGGGVTVDLCALVSRDVSAALDVSELIPHAYQLEVASPGVERALRSTEELARFVDQLVKVMLVNPAEDGQRVLRGPVVSVAESTFDVLVDGKQITVAVSNVKQVNLQLEFGSAHKKTGGPTGKAKKPHPAKAKAKASATETADEDRASSASDERPPGEQHSSPKAPHSKAADRPARGTDAPSPRETDGETQGRGISAGTE